MHKKLILTSILAISVTGAAHATSHSGSFPNDGKMLEDWTYTNAANETNVGTDGGNVNATANYEWNEIALPAGKYLPADTDGIQNNLEDCTAGNFCAGTGNTLIHYNQSQAQGLTECPSGYGNSAVGSTANTDCYRTCNISNMTTTSNPNGTIANIAHAATLTGNDYYGNGTDTCEPATCDTGYQVNPGNPDLMAIIGANEDDYADDFVATDNAGETKNGNPSTYGINNEHLGFAVDYGERGAIRGHGRCSTRNVTTPWIETNNFTFAADHYTTILTDESGNADAIYCYCQLGGYKMTDDDWQTLVAPWVFMSDSYSTGDECAEFCARDCMEYLGGGGAYSLSYRTAVFESITPSLASCEPKTYNITWADTLAADVTANEAATATYGGNINTPVKIDPAVFQTTQKGKRFIGWTFQQQSQTPSVQDPS